MSMSMNDDVDDEQPKGGRGRERDDDDLDDEPKSKDRDDDSDEQDDDDEDADKDEAALRAALRDLRAELKKSNATGARRRKLLQQARAAQGKLDEQDDEDDDEDEKPKQRRRGSSADDVQRAVDKALRKRNAEVEAERLRDRKTSRLETHLAQAGIEGKSLRMLVGQVDLDDLTIEKDGSVDGLEEAVDELRVDFPALFSAKRQWRGRINGGDDRGGRRNESKTKSASQRQADRLLGVDD